VGWSYRRSVTFGPLRVNLSRSGIGYSVGARGFRVGVRADGRSYTRVTIPGTGLSHTTSGVGGGRKAPGCLVLLVITTSPFVVLWLHLG
jgi:hypothetical protein